MEAYFDNSATTKVEESVKDIMVKTMMGDYGNPSSLHMRGVEAEQYVKKAREIIASTLKCQEKEIYFTSGGTESNNMALIGTAMANKRRGNHIITTSVEHPSVSMPLKYLEDNGFEITRLPVDGTGRISPEDFKNAIKDTTIMASAGAQCDHLLHVSTQLPYAILVAIVSFFCYIFTGFIRNWIICLPMGIVVLTIVLVITNKVSKAKAQA